MLPAGWRVVEYRGREALERLEADWRRLYSDMPLRTSYHSYEVHVAYFDLLMRTPHRFRCLALTDGQCVRAICPLEAETDGALGMPVPVWTLPRLPHVLERDAICPEDDARRALLPAAVDYLRRRAEGRRLLVLGPLPESSPLWAGSAEIDPTTYCLSLTEPADVFDCERPFDELVSGLSKHFRRNIRSHRNKLSSLADARFVSAKNTPELTREFEAFMHLEASGWKGPAGSRMAIELRPKHPAFYSSLVTELGNEGSDDDCEINALYVGGHCIASQLCARTGGEYAILKIAYDEAYARFSPGLLLLERTLERCCRDPEIRRMNLLTDGPWQRDWHPDIVPAEQGYVALDRWSARPLIALLRFRFGRGRQIASWLRDVRKQQADRRAERRSGRPGQQSVEHTE